MRDGKGGINECNLQALIECSVQRGTEVVKEALHNMENPCGFPWTQVENITAIGVTVSIMSDRAC
jgi:hypothetical protein